MWKILYLIIYFSSGVIKNNANMAITKNEIITVYKEWLRDYEFLCFTTKINLNIQLIYKKYTVLFKIYIKLCSICKIFRFLFYYIDHVNFIT